MEYLKAEDKDKTLDFLQQPIETTKQITLLQPQCNF